MKRSEKRLVEARKLRKTKEILATRRNPLDPASVAQCGVCLNLGENHCPSEGNANAKLMIVGSTPGAKEVEAQRPFVGPSGELLDLMLDCADIERKDCYITNVVKCRPPGNRAGRPGEITNCKNIWLSLELAKIKPKLVLLVGKDATLGLIGQERFVHGQSYTSKKHDRTFLVTRHPSYYLRIKNAGEFIAFGAKLREVYDRVVKST